MCGRAGRGAAIALFESVRGDVPRVRGCVADEATGAAGAAGGEAGRGGLELNRLLENHLAFARLSGHTRNFESERLTCTSLQFKYTAALVG